MPTFEIVSENELPASLENLLWELGRWCQTLLQRLDDLYIRIVVSEGHEGWQVVFEFVWDSTHQIEMEITDAMCSMSMKEREQLGKWLVLRWLHMVDMQLVPHRHE